MKHTPLLLFTHTFPFGHGEVFLEAEIPRLSEYFKEIIIIPNQIETLHRPPPPSVKIETGFAERYKKGSVKKLVQRIAATLSTRDTYSELLREPSILIKPDHLRTLIYFVSQTQFYYQWLKEYLKQNPNLVHSLFYSYWLHVQSHGICLLKKNDFPNLKHISRAHSYEIYIEDYTPSYLPFRKLYLPYIDHIYTISDHGKNRLLKDHPDEIKSISTSYLGVHDPGFVNPSHHSDTLSLVSTSFLVPEKRIDLLINALKIVANDNPKQKIKWNHFGSGPLHQELFTLAQNLLGDQIEWTFHGQVRREKLFEFYKNEPIDLFINTSRTEGIPVSIMEAQSCGIPVLSTDVGAVSEIVNEKTGKLMQGHPTPNDVAKEIQLLTSDSTKLSLLREGARKNRETYFNADTNFASFALNIMERNGIEPLTSTMPLLRSTN